MKYFSSGNEDNLLSDIDLDSCTVIPLPKYVDQRGFIYLVRSSAFPGFIKIGRTSDMNKRLTAYNSDTPYNAASLVLISECFMNVIEVERRILHYLYQNTTPTTYRKEWFDIGVMDMMVKCIKEAEGKFELEGGSERGSEEKFEFNMYPKYTPPPSSKD